jgi:DNA-3-methyladenine glycosylase
MRRILGPAFFRRDALVVAPALLGKFLVRRVGRVERASMITDVEAYLGPADKASHASRGLTKRNAPMFAAGGAWYVYFTYGMHWILNAVTGREDEPSGIMFRALSDVYGPARLTKKLRIGKSMNKKPIAPASGLWIEDRGVRISKSRICRGPRIGVEYAGGWAKKPFRFFLK